MTTTTTERPRIGRPPAPAETLRPCGTEAAHTRHRRRGEPIDDACRHAHNEYTGRNAAERIRRRRRIERAQRVAREMALEALSHRHAAELEQLYQDAYLQEFLNPSGGDES